MGVHSRQIRSSQEHARHESSRTSKYGFLAVSVWSFLSIMGPTAAFQRSSVHRNSMSQNPHLYSSPQSMGHAISRKSGNTRRNLVDDYPDGRRRQKTKPIPVTGYDPRGIEDFYDRRPLQVGWRLNSLGFPMLGMFFLSFFMQIFVCDYD